MPQILIALSILLFATSLTQTGFYVDIVYNPIPGFSCLLFGWMVLNQGIIAWAANPVLVLAWYFAGFRSKWNDAGLCSFGSLLLALSFLKHQFVTIWGTSLFGQRVETYSITTYGIGYWLWIASISMSLIGCIVAISKPRTSRPAPTTGSPPEQL